MSKGGRICRNMAFVSRASIRPESPHFSDNATPQQNAPLAPRYLARVVFLTFITKVTLTAPTISMAKIKEVLTKGKRDAHFVELRGRDCVSRCTN
jgi:hypothetical protein